MEVERFGSVRITKIVLAFLIEILWEKPKKFEAYSCKNSYEEPSKNFQEINLSLQTFYTNDIHTFLQGPVPIHASKNFHSTFEANQTLNFRMKIAKQEFCNAQLFAKFLSKRFFPILIFFHS